MPGETPEPRFNRAQAEGAPAERRVVAAVRGVIAFALVWGLLALASWFMLPVLRGLEEEWVVPWTNVLLFMVAGAVGWVEYRRAQRE
jgi:fatty acid desaturase